MNDTRSTRLFAALVLLLAGCSLPRATNSSPTVPPTAAPVPTATLVVINVDSCGANPLDDQPDSDAIQACIDRARPGDTVTFTSGVNAPGYQGYLIDKTIFLVDPFAKKDLVFTSTDPQNPALLKGTGSLLGFVIRLYPRSRIQNPGAIDNITLSHIQLDGGRDQRVCFGPDNVQNGIGDNWGSWLQECTVTGDAWCSAGSLAMAGGFNWDNAAQDYAGQPGEWSTGLVVDTVTILNTECGTALAFNGAQGAIRDSAIRTAGDHVHAAGCTQTDPDEPLSGWSDGITLMGPANQVTDNTITNASDVGIVFFGGRDTVISGNTVTAEAGNHGMFAGIAVHPWDFGDVSNVRVSGNRVVNQADPKCGGIHAGINLGPQMWGGACSRGQVPAAIGNSGTCTADPPSPQGALCKPGISCQQWGYVAAGASFTLTDNYVSGAGIDYFAEGLEVDGTFVDRGNTADIPGQTDWEASRTGCTIIQNIGRWSPMQRVAHNPTLPGWTDMRIYCER